MLTWKKVCSMTWRKSIPTIFTKKGSTLSFYSPEKASISSEVEVEGGKANISCTKKTNSGLLIHEADPLSQPVGIIVTCRPFVRPHFSKQNKFQAKTMFAIGNTVGLAEWIIDNTCLVFLFLVLLLTHQAAVDIWSLVSHVVPVRSSEKQ